jgi:urease accessory protein
VRAEGSIRCRFARCPRGTAALELAESGGYRVKFPRGESCTAVLINTGGGMAGGDRLSVALRVEPGAAAVFTTQSAEKVYRAQREPTRVTVSLDLAAGARLAWLPQETILFSGSRLVRSIDATLAEQASLNLLECVTYGRVAMGEVMQAGLLRDSWRIRRGGRLIYAENVHLDGAIAALLDRPAVGAGARAAATFLHVAPDAEGRLEEARAAIAGAGSACGASAWNGLLVVRLLAQDPQVLRADAARFLHRFHVGPLPRMW